MRFSLVNNGGLSISAAREASEPEVRRIRKSTTVSIVFHTHFLSTAPFDSYIRFLMSICDMTSSASVERSIVINDRVTRFPTSVNTCSSMLPSS
jgi:hypothetical protein